VSSSAMKMAGNLAICPALQGCYTEGTSEDEAGALIADAIRDCSRRGEIILDCFGGSGSTLIAAERTGRRARLIEYDPIYCDTIVRRWEQLTGKQAVRATDQVSFADLSDRTQALGGGR